MANIADLFGRLLLDDSGFEVAVVKASEKAGDRAGQSMGSRLNKALKGAAAGALVGTFAGAISGAAKFEDQLRTINTVAKLPDEQLTSLGKEILNLSKSSGKSVADLTQGMYDLVSAGVPAGEAMGVLKDSTVLATGALGTTSEVVDLLTSTLNAYGMATSESGRLTDVFAQAVADGKVTASQLAGAIAQIAPVAANAGISIEEVASGFAVLTARGVPASDAATQMRSAILSLITPNAELNRIQQQTGINFAELAKTQGLQAALQALRDAVQGNDEAFANALGRVEAFNFGLASTGENADAFKAETAKIKSGADTGGVALEQMTEKQKSAVEQGKILTANIQALAIEIGGPFVSVLGPAVTAMGDLGLGFRGLVLAGSGVGALIGGIGGSVTALGTAFDITRIKAIASWLAILGPVAIAAGAGLIFLDQMNQLMRRLNDEQTATALSAGDLSGRMDELNQQLRDGTISQEDYDIAVSRLNNQLRLQAANAHTVAEGQAGVTQSYLAGERAAGKVAAATGDAATATGDAATAAAVLAGATVALTADTQAGAAAMLLARAKTIEAAKAAAELAKWEAIAGDSAAEASNNLLDFASGANTGANEANAAATAAKKLQDALAAIERSITIDILYRARTQPFINPNLPGTGDANRANAFDSGVDPDGPDALRQANDNFLARDRLAKDAAAREQARRDKAAREAETAANKAATAAEQAAAKTKARLEDLASVARNKVGTAFDALRDIAVRAFDRIHEKNLRAIEDARTLAHETNDARLNEAIAAQDAIELGRQRRDLVAELTEAQADLAKAATPEDQASAARRVRSAAEALQSFNARQNIAAIQAEVEAANAAADAAAAKATTVENTRAAREKVLFEAEVAALEQGYADVKSTNESRHADLMALFAKYGLDYRAAGANLGQSFANGLKSKGAAVEAAARSLAAATAAYLKVESPTEKGPLAEDQSKWGERLGTNWLRGLMDSIAGFDLPGLKGIADPLGGASAPYAGVSSAAGAAAGLSASMNVTVDLGTEFANRFGGDRFIRMIDRDLHRLGS